MRNCNFEHRFSLQIGEYHRFTQKVVRFERKLLGESLPGGCQSETTMPAVRVGRPASRTDLELRHDEQRLELLRVLDLTRTVGPQGAP